MLDRGDSLLTLNKPVAACPCTAGPSSARLTLVSKPGAGWNCADLYGQQQPQSGVGCTRTGAAWVFGVRSRTANAHRCASRRPLVAAAFEDRAIALIQRELDLNPGCTQLNSKLADFWFTGGHWEKARANTPSAFASAPNKPMTCVPIGSVQSSKSTAFKAGPGTPRDQFELEAAYLAPSIGPRVSGTYLVLSMQGLHGGAAMGGNHLGRNAGHRRGTFGCSSPSNSQQRAICPPSARRFDWLPRGHQVRSDRRRSDLAVGSIAPERTFRKRPRAITKKPCRPSSSWMKSIRTPSRSRNHLGGRQGNSKSRCSRPGSV